MSEKKIEDHSVLFLFYLKIMFKPLNSMKMFQAVYLELAVKEDCFIT